MFMYNMSCVFFKFNPFINAIEHIVPTEELASKELHIWNFPNMLSICSRSNMDREA